MRIALNDFGTSYSSLSTLRKFPFDKIKIDRSFVSDLSIANVDAIAVVRSIAQLGVSPGLVTTAEGVETKEQMDQVRADRGSLTRSRRHGIRAHALGLAVPCGYLRRLAPSAAAKWPAFG